MEETLVHCRDDEVFELAGRREAQSRLECIIGKIGTVAREGQEGQLAELQGLSIGEGWQVGRGAVGLVGAVRENLEKVEVGGVFGALGESLDLGRLEELGEDEGVWGRGCMGDEVGDGTGGGG